ncbi:MAG: hypothetical protein HWN66_09480 [Candidatus Helarchaeota archaeon]|nr:hypothetical protein [Candidatus Helarchaeota archaeon]
MKIFDTVFLAESVTTRANNLVMITHPKNERDRKKVSPFTKIGRIGGHTIKGWIRHAMAKLLISHGISVCHPLSKISITGDRNKEYFKKDLALGYHSRGECANNGGCLLYHMFGDLDKPANLMTKSVYFYPTISGNSNATRNINRAFGTVGRGRLEVINSSPRCQSESHQVYMTVEHISGVAIEAPLKLILRNSTPDQEVVLLNTLNFLNTMVQNEKFDYLLGGMRTSGYGRANILLLEPKRKKKKQKNASLLENENIALELEEENLKGFKIQFKLEKEVAKDLEKKFQKIIEKEKEKFPIIEKEEKDS